MRHRAAQLAGRIDIDATVGRGTRVCLALPMEARMAPEDRH
jgi:signal transduction histidine kinase